METAGRYWPFGTGADTRRFWLGGVDLRQLGNQWLVLRLLARRLLLRRLIMLSWVEGVEGGRVEGGIIAIDRGEQKGCAYERGKGLGEYSTCFICVGNFLQFVTGEKRYLVYFIFA